MTPAVPDVRFGHSGQAELENEVSVASTATTGTPSADAARGLGPSRERTAEPRPMPPRWWVIFLIMLMANWLLMRALYPVPGFVEVSYTFFTEQVGAGNVADVISQGDVIQGTFKKAVNYPQAERMSRDVTRFNTRPAGVRNVQSRTAARRPEGHHQCPAARHGSASLVGKPHLRDSYQPCSWSAASSCSAEGRPVGRASSVWAGVAPSGTRRAPERVTFDDVAGIEDAKGELVESCRLPAAS